MSIMDIVYENSIPAIEGLQVTFMHQSDVFIMISNVFDPRYAYLFFSPLIFSLDWSTGKKIMWVAVFAEWVSQMLKWALHGERPYWWIHETQVYNKTGRVTPEIQQFFMTCETGPGSPSGHSAVTAAIWYVIIGSYLQKFENKKKSSNIISKFCWLAYLVLLLAVGSSRVFIAAHFPHQCFLGFAVGCLVAWTLDNFSQKQMNTFKYCVFTIGMLASAFLMYGVLKAIDVDPMWSVERAIKWCAKNEYIHLDTTPFFSVMGYSGFMLGMGFGFNSDCYKRISRERFTLSMRITCAALAVGMCKLSEKIKLPKENMTTFYILSFFVNAVLAYSMISVVPNLVSKIWCPKQKKKN